MKNFTIENETNNIIIHASAKYADAVPNSERFGNEAALAKLAANWPAARLIEIWNRLPGEIPVRKFKDRATAVSRIWKAIQNLGQAASPVAEEPAPVAETLPASELITEASEGVQQELAAPENQEAAVPAPVTPQSPHIAPEAAPAKSKVTSAKKMPAAAREKEAGTPREGSKTSQVIAMLRREGGATLEEVMTAMGWKRHTTRAMLSAGGSLTKNHGLIINSEKVGDKRTYTIRS